MPWPKIKPPGPENPGVHLPRVQPLSKDKALLAYQSALPHTSLLLVVLDEL